MRAIILDGSKTVRYVNPFDILMDIWEGDCFYGDTIYYTGKRTVRALRMREAKEKRKGNTVRFRYGGGNTINIEHERPDAYV